MELFPPNSKIDFMGQRRIWFVVSGLLILLSIVGLATRGLNFGIDFTGGLVLEARYPEAVNLEHVREQLAQAGFADAQAQRFGADRDVMIRLPPPGKNVDTKQLGERVLAALAARDPGVQLLRVEYVGPQVGSELANQGGLALLIAVTGILLYVGLRFEFRLASGAIIALVHDVIITIGVIAWTQVTFDLSVLAAVLGIIGYSINDSIVIFDRIRENFIKLRRLTPVEVINASVNQTLSRTIMTNLTVFLVLMALLILGGDTLRPFSIAMVVGSIVGTYSTIYVASSMALQMGVRREHLLPVVREGPKNQL
ncbi:MAG: protein translocase subunit SecF [Pseudomonadota bacterium]|nr:protein translocase subunit SecF [Pseudomonadota bacterium]